MIGILGALSVEVETLCALLKHKEEYSIGSTKFCSGTLGGRDVVIAVCGVGKVNAALCAQAMLLRFAPALVINVGVAGGLHKDMRVGDIAVAESVVQHDFDLTALGEPRGFLGCLNTIHIPCDAGAVSALLGEAQQLDGVRVFKGTIATGDQFISDSKTKAFLLSEFGAVACEMEGGAIGQVCALAGVPFAVLRAISDNADGGAPESFSVFAETAARRSAVLLGNFIENMG